MTSKLTLAIDDAVVSKAKKYAKKRNISLSKLIEFYLSTLTAPAHESTESLPPITFKLSGLVKNKIKAKDKDVIADTLIEKYL